MRLREAVQQVGDVQPNNVQFLQYLLTDSGVQTVPAWFGPRLVECRLCLGTVESKIDHVGSQLGLISASRQPRQQIAQIVGQARKRRSKSRTRAPREHRCTRNHDGAANQRSHCPTEERLATLTAE